MPLYLYLASDAQGKMVRGKQDAADKPGLVRELSAQGLYLVSCQIGSELSQATVQAAPGLPQKNAGSGYKTSSIGFSRRVLVFLTGLQQWSRLEDAKGALRSAGIEAGHPLDRFTATFINGLEKIYRVGVPANQPVTDEMKRKLGNKRDRAVIITFSLSAMMFIVLITRIPFSLLNPMQWSATLEARRFNSDMTRAQVESELGHGIFSMGSQTTYFKSAGQAITVTYDTTGGPMSSDNRVVGHGRAVSTTLRSKTPDAGTPTRPAPFTNPAVPSHP